MKVSLEQVKGIEDLQDLGCYLTHEQQKLSFYLPLQSESPASPLTFPNSGTLSIAIKNSDLEILFESKIDILSLPANGTSWIPLYPQNSFQITDNSFQEAPVQILLQSQTDATYTDQSDTSKIYSKLQDSFQELARSCTEKNKALRQKLLETQHELNHQRWKHQESVQQAKFQYEEETAKLLLEVDCLRQSSSHFKELKQDIQKQAKSYESLYKQEKYQREYLEKQLGAITDKVQEVVKAHTAKQAEYLELVKGKDQEILKLTEKLLNTQEEMRFLQQSNSELKFGLEARKPALDSSEVAERADNLQAKFEESEFQRNFLHQKFQSAVQIRSEELKQFLKSRHESSVISLQQEMTNLKTQLIKAQNKNIQLQNQLEEKELEIFSCTQNYQSDCYKQVKLMSSKLSYKTRQLEQINSHAENAESKLMKAQYKIAKLKKMNQDLTNQQENLRVENSALNSRLEELAQKNREIDIKLSDNADERFNQYLRNYGIQDDFVRVAEGVYTFGNKKVSITIKNGCLVCRVGGGYMMIDQFIKLIIKQKEGSESQRSVASPHHSPNQSVKKGSDLLKENKEENESDPQFESQYTKECNTSPFRIRVPRNVVKGFKPLRSNREKVTPLKKTQSKSNIREKLV